MTQALTVTRPKEITSDQDVLRLVSDWHAALNLQVAAGDLSPATARTYQKGLEKFLTWCDRADVQSLDADTVQSWKASLIALKCKPNTINVWLSGVRAFFSWSVAKRRLAFNPTEGVKGAKRKDTTKHHRREALTSQEVKRLLSQPDTSTAEGARDLAWLSLAVYTGVRTIEIHRATLADLRTTSDRLVLDVTGKGHDDADDLVVIANPKAQEALYSWLSIRGDKPGALFVSMSDRSRGQALSLQALRGLWLKYKRSAGVVGQKSLHSLRHTAITSAIKHGAKPIQASKMARHKSIETTMIYYHELDRLSDPAEAFISYDD